MDIKSSASATIKAMLTSANTSNRVTASGLPIQSQQAAVITEKSQLVLSEILPGAIYHADDPVTAQTVDVDYSKITLSRSRLNKPNHDRHVIDAMVKVNDVSERAKHLYADFKQQLEKAIPELVGKEFGFSVQQNGNFTIINNHGDLSEPEQKQLTEFINNFSGASALSAQSLKFAKASFELLEADRGYRNASSEIGKFNLTVANFSDFIDLSEIFGRAPNANWATVDLENQLNDSKADIKYNRDESETYIDGEWVKDFDW